MSSVLTQPLTFHAPRPVAAQRAAGQWSVDEIEALFNLPLPELMHRA